MRTIFGICDGKIYALQTKYLLVHLYDGCETVNVSEYVDIVFLTHGTFGSLRLNIEIKNAPEQGIVTSQARRYVLKFSRYS